MFKRSLVSYIEDEVYYDSIKIGITQQNIQDYVIQTGMSGETFILFYYKKSISELRDKQLSKILNDRER